MDKITYGNLRDYVRAVLFFKWDPIGVKEDAVAYDEYHTYADIVVSMLLREESDSQIARYLDNVQVERMELASHRVHCTEIAQTCKRAFDDLRGFLDSPRD